MALGSHLIAFWDGKEVGLIMVKTKKPEGTADGGGGSSLGGSTSRISLLVHKLCLGLEPAEESLLGSTGRPSRPSLKDDAPRLTNPRCPFYLFFPGLHGTVAFGFGPTLCK